MAAVKTAADKDYVLIADLFSYRTTGGAGFGSEVFTKYNQDLHLS